MISLFLIVARNSLVTHSYRLVSAERKLVLIASTYEAKVNFSFLSLSFFSRHFLGKRGTFCSRVCRVSLPAFFLNSSGDGRLPAGPREIIDNKIKAFHFMQLRQVRILVVSLHLFQTPLSVGCSLFLPLPLNWRYLSLFLFPLFSPLPSNIDILLIGSLHFSRVPLSSPLISGGWRVPHSSSKFLASLAPHENSLRLSGDRTPGLLWVSWHSSDSNYEIMIPSRQILMEVRFLMSFFSLVSSFTDVGKIHEKDRIPAVSISTSHLRVSAIISTKRVGSYFKDRFGHSKR